MIYPTTSRRVFHRRQGIGIHVRAGLPILVGVLQLFGTSRLGAAPSRLTGTVTAHETLLPATSRPRLNSLFRSYACYRLDIGSIKGGLRKTAGTSGRLRLQLGDHIDVELSLRTNEQRSDTYVLRGITPGGVRTHPRYPPCTFTGVCMDDDRGEVRLTVGDCGIEGFVEKSGERIYVEPVRNLDPGAPDDLIVAYRAGDVRRTLEHACGLAADHGEPPLPALAKRGAAAEDPSCMIADLALAAHYSMVEGYGSVKGVEERITSILNLVNEMYADPRVNIIHELVELVVDETGDEDFGGVTSLDRPGFSEWAATEGNFTNEWDIAGAYFFNRGGGTVGRAKMGGVCTAGGAHIIRDFTSSLRSMYLDHAHELGHNWGASHVSSSSCLMYPSITGKNDNWCESTIATIVKYRNTRTCLAGCDQPPVADFSVEDSNSCTATIQCKDRSRYGPRSWLWDFGDGTTSTERHPVHAYRHNGVYSISLTVANDQGEDSETKSDWLTIDAPAPPVVSPAPNGCDNTGVTLSATGPNTIKWYDIPIGGVPLHVGEEFESPSLTGETTFYVENGPAEFPVKSIGPVDTTETDSGAYKETAGNIFMEFETYKPLRFRSFTVYANKEGPRHFVLTRASSMSGLEEHVVTLEAGRSAVHCNWTIEKPATYRIWLENTVGTGEEPDSPEEYFNNLYRARDGITYPVELEGLMAITTNYWRESPNGDPTSNGWYIGYDWKVQQIEPCAGARIPVTANQGCNPTFITPPGKSTPVRIAVRDGRLQLLAPGGLSETVSVSVYTASGRQVYHAPKTRIPLSGGSVLLWDGTNRQASPVARSMYLCRLRVGTRHFLRTFFLGD